MPPKRKAITLVSKLVPPPAPRKRMREKSELPDLATTTTTRATSSLPRKPRLQHKPIVPSDTKETKVKLEFLNDEIDATSQYAKKLKLHETYATVSPFPDWPKPTRTDASEVFDLLSQYHHNGPAPLLLPTRVECERTMAASLSAGKAKNSAESCGSVPKVLDALVGVVLSQNTSGANSSLAKRSLDDKFSPESLHGLDEASFEVIAESPKATVVEAIKKGGLANKKAQVIQTLLREVKRRYGKYSLEHLAGRNLNGDNSFTDAEIMKELISYPGIGPKSASCVLLFCLARPSFAVDTHVFRLCKLLGWLPKSVKADRVRAQMHLDLKLPDELKYGLHVLFIRHGRLCRGCKKASECPTDGDDPPEGGCILKDYMRAPKRVSDSLQDSEKEEG